MIYRVKCAITYRILDELGLFLSDLADRLDDPGQLRSGRHLERIGQTDARDELAGDEPRTSLEVIEKLVDGAANEVLAEVGDFGVLVHEDRAAGFLDAFRDHRPVVRPE